MATVSSKGQITLPKFVRDELGLTAGSRVEFAVEHGRVVLRREIQRAELTKWRGYLKDRYPGRTSDDLVAEMRDHDLGR